jgi:hypothetical protein
MIRPLRSTRFAVWAVLTLGTAVWLLIGLPPWLIVGTLGVLAVVARTCPRRML